jgi:D-alanyl-D-alanine carboxypeptidase/D-alanyl-D-alanine-endopeptidase (penicillin-binding protein 4)
MRGAAARFCRRIIIVATALAGEVIVSCNDDTPSLQGEGEQTARAELQPSPAKADRFADDLPQPTTETSLDSGNAYDDTWILGARPPPAEEPDAAPGAPTPGFSAGGEPTRAWPANAEPAKDAAQVPQKPAQVVPKWQLFADDEPDAPEATSPGVPERRVDAGLRSRAAKFSVATPVDTPAAPEVLSMRLEALSTRVAHMHKAWEAARHAGQTRSALSREAMRLSQRVALVIDRAEHRATVSVHVRDLKSQHVLLDHNGEELRNPASNHKMLTASAALDLLGPEYRFETQVFRAGRILYVVGEGDPTLTAKQVARIAKTIGQDISPGDITTVVVDDLAFSEERFIPGIKLDNIGFSYAAPTGAFSMSDNSVRVVVQPTAPGSPPRVSVHPDNAHVQVHSTAVTVRNGEADARIYIRTRLDGAVTVVDVTGKIAQRSEPVAERRRIYDPAAFAGATFAQALADATGGPVPQLERGNRPENAHLLRAWSSAPLFHVVKRALAHSNNFATEQILRTLAWRMTDTPGSFEQGASVLESYWATIGVSPESLVAENGSGLSRAGRFTATGLTDLVSAAHMTQPPNSGLIAVLPGAGESGTLKHRQLRARGRLRAKTGTLNGVSALTGVLRDLDGGAALALSIMINPGTTSAMSTHERHVVEEQIVYALLDHMEARRKRRDRRRSH